ncbi:hypothetical protein D3C84_772890 [compost metagenome]
MGGEHVVDDHQLGVDVHRHPFVARLQVVGDQRAHVNFQVGDVLRNKGAVLDLPDVPIEFFLPLGKLLMPDAIAWLGPWPGWCVGFDLFNAL